MLTRSRVFDIAKTSFTASDTMLFDANIWLFLRRPEFARSDEREKRATAIYTAAAKEIIEAKATIVLDVLVLSEYWNRFCRLEMKALRHNGFPDFKKFRKSPDFVAVGARAAGHAKEILRIAECRKHEFESKTVEDAIGRLAGGASDFNDEMLIDACRRNQWKMVTHDGDFEYGGIEVLTANPRLLARCRDSGGGADGVRRQ